MFKRLFQQRWWLLSLNCWELAPLLLPTTPACAHHLHGVVELQAALIVEEHAVGCWVEDAEAMFSDVCWMLPF